mgnify:CR=1 FL=1
MDIEFEFDAEKSRANKGKHGIDFMKAQALWDDVNVVEWLACSDGEERFIVTGQIEGKFWTAVITYRENKIRIISARRSRKKEVEGYEERQKEENYFG